MKKKYAAAVIGCGRVGAEEWNYSKDVQPETHAASYKNNARINLAGLADINREKLKNAGKYFPEVALFNSAEDMFLKIKPDIVSIATNSDTHASLVKLAAKYKIPAILCEKPIAESVKQAEGMIKKCKESKSMLFINHQRRFDPLLQRWVKPPLMIDKQHRFTFFAFFNHSLGLFHRFGNRLFTKYCRNFIFCR